VLLAALVTSATPVAPTAGAPPPDADRMTWWREARFGLFIHWGLYAIPAGAWDGDARHAEWIRHTAQIPVTEYDELRGRFDPVRFDADEWVRVAKAAGMKYIVITSKHHDGFCLFDSAHTGFDVMSTPFRRDIMKELADACRREGLRICWYHSIMDWHHPDYLPRRGWERDARPEAGADFDAYVAHLHRQVEELLTRYGPIGVMWFDGEWEATWTHEHGRALYDLCRRLQPDVIVNNRVDKGRGGMAGLTEDAKYLGDFGTPEQQIPATGLPGVDWETCMTMNRHWGYNARDDDWKSTAELIRTLVDVASKGGNFLLNVGPKADGTFPDESVERLEAMGAWLRVNGSAIYGTGASPFAHLPWGRCTVRAASGATDAPGGASTLYLHVFDWPEDGLVVPGIGNEPRAAWLLAAPGERLRVTRDAGDLRIALPRAAPDPACSVVALEVEGAPVVYAAPGIVAAATTLVRPRRVVIEVSSPALAVRYTLDGTDPGVSSALYEGPFDVADTVTVKTRAFHRGRPVSGVTERTFLRVTPSPARAGGAGTGLVRRTFAGDWDALPDFETLEPVETRVVRRISLEPEPRAEHVAHRFTGFVRVPRDDVYVFALDSDDGSRLVVDGVVVVDNDGLHGPRERRGEIALARGAHAIVLEWFNKTGGAELDLRFAPAGERPVPPPPSALGH
jgi:alpha-L-fucosidase